MKIIKYYILPQNNVDQDGNTIKSNVPKNKSAISKTLTNEMGLFDMNIR